MEITSHNTTDKGMCPALRLQQYEQWDCDTNPQRADIVPPPI